MDDRGQVYVGEISLLRDFVDGGFGVWMWKKRGRVRMMRECSHRGSWMDDFALGHMHTSG